LWCNLIIKGGEALAGNYEKDLFNHNQKLIAENEKLKVKAVIIEFKAASKYSSCNRTKSALFRIFWIYR